MAACRYHPDRPGIGVCMRCRCVICASCCTRVDGVNHCHACLRALGRGVEPRRSSSAQATVSLLAATLLAFASLFGFGVMWLIEGRLAP
jgi:hypothetical protein